VRRAISVLLLSGGLVWMPAPVFAQETLQVSLDAPESVRGLLEEHLRILNRPDQAIPDDVGDRVALFRRARREIASLLATEGYFAPEVSLDRAERGDWTIVVDPGERARIADVDIGFEGHIAEEGEQREQRRRTLVDEWLLPVDEPFRQSDWDSAKQSLLYGVRVRDYATARIRSSRAEVNPETASVRLRVRVDSGEPYFLGPLEVSGIEKLPSSLVERYSNLSEGDPYDQNRLLAFQRNLQNAPQFASVSVDINRDPLTATAAPVEVQVSEAESRHLGFGVGYSTNTGARTEVNWRDVNFRGRAWELSTGLRLEQARQTIYSDIFLPPSRAGHRDSFGAVAERSDIEGLQANKQAIGGVRTRQRGDIETALALRYQQETLRPSGADRRSYNALTAKWTWTQRKVDDLLDPRQGYVLQGEFGGGAEALLSDQNFFRSYGRFAYYFPVRERDVFITRAEVGKTFAPSREGIPQDFLFRTGGSQSVRGYAYNSLGVQEGNAILGGRYLATASAEYVNWFRPQWGAAAFVDAGDAADDTDSFDPRVGYGVGARYRTPAGPIALDVAYGHQDRRFRLHFSIAVAF